MLNFLNIHRKSTLLEFLFNKVAILKACNFIKKEAPTKVFLCVYCEVSRNTSLEERLREAAWPQHSKLFAKFSIRLVCSCFKIQSILSGFYSGYKNENINTWARV